MRTIIITGVYMIISMVAFAQAEEYEFQGEFKFENAVITLEDAIKVSVANNPEINRALLSVKDADQLVRIAYGEVYPSITSSINYTRNIQIPVQYIPAQFFDPNAPEDALAPVEFGTDNNWQGGFTVTQNIFQGDVFVGISTSTIFKTVQQENLRAVTQQVITQARIAYYGVLAAKEQYRLQQVQIERLEKNLKDNRARKVAGLVDDYDVLQLEVQLSNQRPLMIEARYGVDEAYRNLKMVMGLPLSLQFEVRGNLNEFDIVTDESLTEENLQLKKIDRMNPFAFQKDEIKIGSYEELRGDLRILDARIDLKDREILAIKSRFMPSISATYNLQWSAAQPGTPTFFRNQPPNESANRFQTLGINVSLPIFEGFKRMADVQRAQIQLKDIREQVRATELAAENEIASAAEALNKAFETAESRRMAQRQAREGYDRAQKRLENGIGSQMEVTDAEVQVRQAEVNYAIMVYEYLVAKANYDLATGKVPFVDTDTE